MNIPPFPLPDEQRLNFDSIADEQLATVPHRPSYERFQSDFITPIKPFLSDGHATNPAILQQQLSLHKALYHAFSSNQSVQVRDLQVTVEAERLQQAEAIFTPTLELSSDYAESKFPQNAAESASNNLFPTSDDPSHFFSQTAILEASIQGESRAGTEYELYSNLSFNESTLTQRSSTAIYAEEYTTNIGLRLSQPLLRNSSRKIREAPIRIARINRRIASADLQTELTALAQRTLEAYCLWLEADEILELRNWEQRTYQQLAEIVRNKVETGEISTLESLRADIRLSRIADQILRAEEELEFARQRLYREFGRESPEIDNQQMRPAGEMSAEIPTLSAQVSIEHTLANSSEIERYRQELAVAQENLDIALDETKASLNLVGGIEIRGLNDAPGTSLESLANDSPTSYNVGIVYSRPWGSHGAEAKVRENRLLVRQQKIELERIEQEIRNRVQTEIARLEVLRSRRDNLEQIQTKIGDEIERENLRLETGQSTLSSLFEFYEEVFQARAQFVNVLTQINEAKSRLWAADQTLLRRLGVNYHDSFELNQ